MSGLPDGLINSLRDTLSRCDAFESDETLRALFADERLSPWRSQLPHTKNIQQRAENAIDFLYDKFRGDANALLSLLDGLQGRLDPGDNLHGELAQLAQALAAYLPTEASQAAESPYKGLLYYDVGDAPLFFGRDRVTQELLDHLRQHRFLAVVGASGSGKSSVVRAGVIPALQQGAIEIGGRSSRDWPIHIITPGDEPLKALAASLTRDSDRVTATVDLLADLQTSSQSLDLFLYRQMAGQADARLLLLIDQFEELFTQCDDGEARRLLVENLVTAVNSGQQGRLSLILTLRADFYAQAVPYEGLRPLLERQQKIVGAMTAAELRQAIETPAAQAGWDFEPGLIDRLLADVGVEPGALPLLSHALLETWRRRQGRTLTHAGYVASGQVAGAIAATAQRTFDDLTPDQQTIARHIFLQLTELGEGTEDTRRRVERERLTSQPQRMAQIEEVLTILANARLVTTGEQESGGEEELTPLTSRPSPLVFVEVAHEALIRNWPELRCWLDENREGLRLQRRLASDAKEWNDHDQEESYLYRGGQLAQIQEWLIHETPDLHPLETAFVSAGVERQERDVIEQEARRQHELEQAQQLAAEAEARHQAEAQRASAVRRALVVVALLLGVAVSFAFFGFGQRNVALDAADARGTAVIEADLARKEAEANEARAAAQTSEAEALLAAKDLATAVAKAEESAALAQSREAEAEGQRAAAERQSRISLAQSLAALAPTLLQQRSHDTELATLLALEALRLNAEEIGDVVWLADSSLRFLLGEPYFNNTLSGHGANVESVAFSPDGRWLASGSGDSTVRLWEVDNLQDVPTILSGHGASVSSVAFSPDDASGEVWLASGGADRAVRLWDMDDPQAEPTILNGHKLGVESVAFSPNGRWLASGSADQTVRLWEVEKLDMNDPEAAPTILSGHESFVWSVAFSPDGRWLASGSDDRTVRLWDMNNPEAEPTILSGHESFVWSVAFSPDGRWLASGSADQTVRLQFTLEVLAEIGCQKVRRNLTQVEWSRYLGDEPYHRTCADLPPGE